ncbi:PrgI family protein, partial [Patescibacteria group bacterium]
QNVDIEDKLIGPLTLKQFLYLLGGGILEFLWFSMFDMELFILISIPTIGLAAAFAFVKIYDKPFIEFLLVMAHFVITSRRRVWKRVPGALTIQSTKDQGVKTKHKEEENRLRELAKEKQIRMRNLSDLAVVLDTVGGLEKPSKTK